MKTCRDCEYYDGTRQGQPCTIYDRIRRENGLCDYTYFEPREEEYISGAQTKENKKQMTRYLDITNCDFCPFCEFVEDGDEPTGYRCNLYEAIYENHLRVDIGQNIPDLSCPLRDGEITCRLTTEKNTLVEE